jgi:anti-sigma regulatory factor (Ser/Thr protein kinase)
VNEGATEYTELRNQLSAVPDARRRLRELCAAHGTAPDIADRAELALAEVVTNALTHGLAPVELVLAVDAASVTVTVADAGTTPVESHRATTEDAHGRGLAIVAAVATAWGWNRRPHQTHLVWFAVGSTSPAPAAGLLPGA